VPDEFYSWVKQQVSELTGKYSEIEAACKANFRELETRKDTALYFKSQPHQQVLFSMLDKRDYAPVIWRLIKPEYTKPFKVEV
jgi:RNA ligase